MTGNEHLKHATPSLDAVGLGFAALVAAITVAAATLAYEGNHINVPTDTVSLPGHSQLGLDTVSWLNGIKTFR